MTSDLVDDYLVVMETATGIYQIRVRGHFDPALIDWFMPLTISNEPNGNALLTGPLRDQAELYGVLLKLYNLNFTLLTVQLFPGIPTHDVTEESREVD